MQSDLHVSVHCMIIQGSSDLMNRYLLTKLLEQYKLSNILAYIYFVIINCIENQFFVFGNLFHPNRQHRKDWRILKPSGRSVLLRLPGVLYII